MQQEERMQNDECHEKKENLRTGIVHTQEQPQTGIKKEEEEIQGNTEDEVQLRTMKLKVNI